MFKEFIPYNDQEIGLEGFIAYPSKEKQPTVVLCHAWNGRDEYICQQAQLIAGWGYAAFAIDIYGKGVLGKSPKENADLKQPFLSDRNLLKQRIIKGYETICTHPFIDETNMVVIGFGFGGVCALDFARYIKTLKGAISVYGHFEPPNKTANQLIKSKVLLLHGYDDPIVTMDELLQFQEELSANAVDWQTHLYSQSMHAFTTPSANSPELGIAYNQLSTKRAWKNIRNFVDEVLQPSS